MAAAPPDTRTVKAECRYIHPSPPPGAGLANSSDIPPELYKKARHLLTQSYEVTFHDARTTNGGLGSWNFDKNGLVCFTPPPFPQDPTFENIELTRAEYWPQLAEQAKKLTGAKECHVYQMALREPNPKNIFMNPAKFAHCDASTASPAMWKTHLKKKFKYTDEQLEQFNICMCNIWHPREVVAFKDPLCLLDGSTVDWERDVANIPYVNAKGETDSETNFSLCGPSFNPNHRWIFISDQRPDEAWLFKQYDMRENVAKFSFHNSFVDPTWHKDATKPGRRSVEFRMYLMFPKPGAKL